MQIATRNLLNDFRREIREIAAVQRERARTAKDDRSSNMRRLDGEKDRLPEITMQSNESSVFLPEGDDEYPQDDPNLDEDNVATDTAHRELGGL